MEPARPVQFYVLVTAMVAAPFLGLLVDPNLGLMALIAALAATIYVILDARPQVAAPFKRRLLLVCGGLGALLVLTVILLLTRSLG